MILAFYRNITYISLRMQLNEKLPSLEAQLPNLGPRKCIDFDKVLKHENAQVCNRKMQRYTFMILATNRTRYNIR
jgi:hypothetical protein